MKREKNYGVVANWNYIIISLVVVSIITMLVMYLPNMQELDRNLLDNIRMFLNQFPSYIPAVVTEFGRANSMLWPQITACSVLVSHGKYLKAFLLVFFTQASFLLVGLLKNFVCRERPCVYPGFSFPSGHSATTMCFYGICMYLILHYTANKFLRYFLATALGIFIFFVAVSRLWLGVHFLTDVVAGLFLGFLLVNLYIVTAKAFGMKY